MEISRFTKNQRSTKSPHVGTGPAETNQRRSCFLWDNSGEGNTVKRGEEGTRLDTPSDSEETTDPEGGSGESRGLGALRLNKPRGMGMMRERTTPATPGRLGRRPRVVTSSHNAELRHRNLASNPERVSDDGG